MWIPSIKYKIRRINSHKLYKRMVSQQKIWTHWTNAAPGTINTQQRSDRPTMKKGGIIQRGGGGGAGAAQRDVQGSRVWYFVDKKAEIRRSVEKSHPWAKENIIKFPQCSAWFFHHIYIYKARTTHNDGAVVHGDTRIKIKWTLLLRYTTSYI